MWLPYSDPAYGCCCLSDLLWSYGTLTTFISFSGTSCAGPYLTGSQIRWSTDLFCHGSFCPNSKPSELRRQVSGAPAVDFVALGLIPSRADGRAAPRELLPVPPPEALAGAPILVKLLTPLTSLSPCISRGSQTRHAVSK